MTKPKLYQFDSYSQKVYPASFLSLVANSYETNDLELLQNIICDKEIEHEKVASEIRQIMAMNSLIMPNLPSFLDHFSVLQQIYHKSNPEDDPYTISRYTDETSNSSFSFLKSNILEILDSFSSTFNSPIIVLFYTPLGFMRLHLPDISIQDACFAIVVSKTQAFMPQTQDLAVRIPTNIYPEKRSEIYFYHLVRFCMQNGCFQPVYQEESFFNYITNTSSSTIRLDGLGFPVDANALRLIPIVGLFGRNSQIRQHLQHFKICVNAESFSDSLPFIGLYLSNCGTNFVFLYIPDDLPPTHPSFAAISSYSFSFMKSVCSRVLCLSEPELLTNQTNFNVNGFMTNKSSCKPRFLGSYQTANILRTDLKLTIGKNGRDSLVFSGSDELIKWKNWMSRFYQLRIFSKPSLPNSIPIDLKLVLLLLKGNSQENIKNVIKSTSKLSETEERIKHAYIHKTEQFDVLINEIMDNFNPLFIQAARLSSTAIKVHDSTCNFCKMSIDEKPDVHSSHWCDMCQNCQLMKLQQFNNNHPDAKRPTQFLEDEILDINENKKETEDIIARFRNYYLNQETQSFMIWFLDTYTFKCLTANREELRDHPLYDNNSIDIFKPQMSISNLPNYISNLLMKRFSNPLDYYMTLLDICTKIPVELTADQLRKEYMEFYVSTMVPVFCKPLIVTPDNWNKQCLVEYERVMNSGKEKDNAVEIGSLSCLPDGSIDVEVNWVNNQKIESLSNDFVFMEIIDLSKISPIYSKRPVATNQIFKLISQPKILEIVNCFRITGKSILLTKFGTSLWINCVPDGFSSSYLNDPIISLEVDLNCTVFSAFSAKSNLLVFSYKFKDVLYIRTIRISPDFKTAETLSLKPAKKLLPVSSVKDFSSKLYGISIDEEGKIGILGSDYLYTDCEQQYVVIKFDVLTLMAFERADKFDTPFTPLFFGSDAIIYHSLSESALKPEGISYTAALDKLTLDETLGIVEWRNYPCLIKSIAQSEPVLITREDKVDFQLSFFPIDCVKFAARCIQDFGLGETERLSEGFYSNTSISVETVFDLRGNAVNSYFQSGKEIAEATFGMNGGSIITTAHMKPSGNESILELDQDPPKGSQRRAFFPFISKILCGPRILVSGQLPKDDSQKWPRSSYEKCFIYRLKQMPVFTMMREMIPQNIETKNISVVNCYADGSPLLSAISSHPFMSASPSSIRVASSIVPISFNKLNKYDKFYVINSISFSPLNTNSSSDCAISFLHSLFVGGLVIMYSSKNISFIIDILLKASESVPFLEEICPMKLEKIVKLVIICDVDEEIELIEQKIKNGVLSSANKTISKIISEIHVLPQENGIITNANLIMSEIDIPATTIEDSLMQILYSSASYGALLDNKELFLE